MQKDELTSQPTLAGPTGSAISAHKPLSTTDTTASDSAQERTSSGSVHPKPSMSAVKRCAFLRIEQKSFEERGAPSTYTASKWELDEACPSPSKTAKPIHKAPKIAKKMILRALSSSGVSSVETCGFVSLQIQLTPPHQKDFTFEAHQVLVPVDDFEDFEVKKLDTIELDSLLSA